MNNSPISYKLDKNYLKIFKNCEDCGDQGAEEASFKEKIWAVQLQAKQIMISGDIKENLIEKAVMQIMNFNDIDDEARLNPDERQPIKIFINSSGGFLDETFSLISAIEASKTPVITIALGKAYSAGFLILLAGHARYAQKYSTLMYHQGSAGVAGEFNRMIEYAKHWENCQVLMEDYVLRQTKIKKKKLEQIFSHKQDWYMQATEALQLGIIDGIWQ